MIDLTIRKDGFYVDSLFQTDNYNHKIILGTKLDRLNKKIKAGLLKEALKQYRSINEILDGNLEISLTHETIHVVLFHLIGCAREQPSSFALAISASENKSSRPS